MRGQWNTLETVVYDKSTTSNIPAYHSSFNFRATYTFGYGKKVKRGSEVGATYGASSAALNTGD